MMTVNFTNTPKAFKAVNIGDVFVLEDNGRGPYIRIEELFNPENKNYYNAINLQTGKPHYFDREDSVIIYKDSILTLGR